MGHLQKNADFYHRSDYGKYVRVHVIKLRLKHREKLSLVFLDILTVLKSSFFSLSVSRCISDAIASRKLEQRGVCFGTAHAV